MSNFVKIRDDLIVDTEKICFVEPFNNDYRINFIGGSSICMTKKEWGISLDEFRVRVYVLIFELEGDIEEIDSKFDSKFFDKNILISTWSTYDKAITARDNLIRYYKGKGGKEQIRVSVQFVDGR